MVLLASKRRGYEGHAASRASALASLKGGCLYPCSPLAGARAQQHQPCRQGPPLKGWTPIIITRGSRQKSSLMAQLVRSAPHALTARGTCWAVGFRFTAFVGQPGSKGHKQQYTTVHTPGCSRGTCWAVAEAQKGRLPHQPLHAHQYSRAGTQRFKISPSAYPTIASIITLISDHVNTSL